MKKLFNYVFISAFLVLSLGGNATPISKKEFKKTTNQSFKISDDGIVKINNKFGNINVETWAKDQVDFNITISVKTDGESNAERMFNRISFRFSEDGEFVQAETIIKDKQSSWNVWNWDWNESSLEFSIDYDVKLPRNASLELKNVHGNAIVSKIGGTLKSNIQHGDIRIQEVSKDANMYLAFGSGYLGSALQDAYLEVKHGKMTLDQGAYVAIEIKHSDFNLGEAEDLKIISKHGDYDIGTVKKIRCDSKYDDYQIRSTNDIEVMGKFSDFNINKVSGRAVVDLQHGGLKMSIPNQFEEVLLNGSHSSFRVWVENDIPFQFEGQSVHGTLRLPQTVNVNYEKEERHEHQIKCSSGSGNKGYIKAKVVHGSVKVIKE